MDLQTEFEFVLPKGFLDEQGNLHREGTMRLATAIDEIAPLRDAGDKMAFDNRSGPTRFPDAGPIDTDRGKKT